MLVYLAIDLRKTKEINMILKGLKSDDIVISKRTINPDFLDEYAEVLDFEVVSKIVSSTAVHEDIFYDDTNKKIRNASVVIAEISDITPSVAFELNYALSQNIPVFALQSNTNLEIKDLALTKSQFLTVKQYSDIEEIPKHIKNFLRTVHRKITEDFLFVMPPDLQNYIQWSTNRRRTYKSEIVREAVYAQMKEDREWQEELM